MKKALPKVSTAALKPCRWKTVGVGALFITVGWLTVGLSLAAILAAMHKLPPLALQPESSRGFCRIDCGNRPGNGRRIRKLHPGGLGAREWILAEMLTPVIGSEHAIVGRSDVADCLDRCGGRCRRRLLDCGSSMESKPGKSELISIVVPVLNESESLEELGNALLTMAATHGLHLEVIFVDDGSRMVRGIRFAGLPPLTRAFAAFACGATLARLPPSPQGSMPRWGRWCSRWMRICRTTPRKFQDSWPSWRKDLTSLMAGSE